MSELASLIEISRNIENQNREIIRLLKIIAGEDDSGEVEDEVVFKSKLLDADCRLGEVYFVDGGDVFKLTVENNETIINNLTGDGKCSEFNLFKLVADESIKRNHALDASTVILSQSVKGKLPETLRICINHGAKKVYSPWKLMAELIRAPQDLQILLQLDFYKSDDELIGKLF